MSRLLINENPLQVLPTLACAIGLNEAIVLQQIHYWMNISQNFHDGRRWVYNSVPSWQAQFPFWSGSTVKRALANLEKLQMVHTANYNSDSWDKTKWYSVNYEVLAAMESTKYPVDDRLGQIDPIEGAKMSQGAGQNDLTPRVKMTSSPTENTTETTTENPPNPQEGEDADAPGEPPKIKYQDVADAYNEMDRRMKGDAEMRNLYSGIEELDAITGGWNPQDLIVVAGRPGMGKTEFALKVIEGATRSGGGALIFSMEMAALQMVERSVAGAGNLSVSKLRKPESLCDEDWGRIHSALEVLNNRDIWIVDATDLTVDQIRAITETHKRRYPHLSVVMVDFWVAVAATVALANLV